MASWSSLEKNYRSIFRAIRRDCIIAYIIDVPALQIKGLHVGVQPLSRKVPHVPTDCLVIDIGLEMR